MGPKTLDELIAVVPGISKCRGLNAPMLRRLLDRQRKECTWCGTTVPKGRSTWCSDECLQAFQQRCCTHTQRSVVTQRDGGICKDCGRDIRAARKASQQEIREKINGFGSLRERRKIQESHGWGRGHWEEVDHLIPVIEGGGLMGTDNLRLLCGQCHLRATRELAARRKKTKTKEVNDGASNDYDD